MPNAGCLDVTDILHFLLGNEIFRLDMCSYTSLSPSADGLGCRTGVVQLQFPPAGQASNGQIAMDSGDRKKSLSQVGPIFLPFIFE